MPVNYQQIKGQTTRFYERTAEHYRVVRSATGLLMKTLDQLGKETDELSHTVDAEARINRSLRCAHPFAEPPAGVYHLPGKAEPVTLIAADGSQINPSRHRQVDFSLINVATICMQNGVDAAPTYETESTLLDDYDLNIDSAPLTEDFIALERDLRERNALYLQSSRYPAPVITLTDGPLELFREIGETTRFEKKLNEYIEILDACRRAHTVTAGYVDKPQSDLVNRMLRLPINKTSDPAGTHQTELERIRVPDASLFSGLLPTPGDRSAVFSIQSPWSKSFKDGLELCFFYLNVSRSEKPCLARVELPAWCAGTPRLLDDLHFALFRQCEIMGTRPYPYILHRAHEIAVITFEETSQIENMLAAEMQGRGLETESKSNKQSAKELPGRGRYP
jgi:NurA domain